MIYDDSDNIVTFCNDLIELSNFTGRSKKYFKFAFKNRYVVNYIYHNSYRKIYKFIEI